MIPSRRINQLIEEMNRIATDIDGRSNLENHIKAIINYLAELVLQIRTLSSCSEICPVCLGKRKVPFNFYEHDYSPYSQKCSNTTDCRYCLASGTINKIIQSGGMR